LRHVLLSALGEVWKVRGILLVLALAASPGNWCRPGDVVIVPDGREGTVTSVEGDICRVLTYGEKFVSLWKYDLIEPAFPQYRRGKSFGH
jgi:hypothetical protein